MLTSRELPLACQLPVTPTIDEFDLFELAGDLLREGQAPPVGALALAEHLLGSAMSWVVEAKEEKTWSSRHHTYSELRTAGAWTGAQLGARGDLGAFLADRGWRPES